MPLHRDQGNTMAEYGLIGGLVILVALGGLMALGGSIAKIGEQFSTGLAQRKKPLSIAQTGIVASYAGKNSNLPGSEHAIVIHNPNTARPSLEVLNHKNGTIEVMGIDGTRENTLGTIMLANTFEDLAQEEVDPKSAEYIRKLAEVSYYLGAAQGNVDGVKALTAPQPRDGFYNTANALADIHRYHSKMTTLLSSPPTTMGDRTKKVLMPLANEVREISQRYLDNYKSIINQYGHVSYDASIDSFRGDGTPGSSLGKSLKGDFKFGTFYKQVKSYSDLVSYEEVKAKASRVLSDNKVESVTVETTLTDAQKTDQLAERLAEIKEEEENN